MSDSKIATSKEKNKTKLVEQIDKITAGLKESSKRKSKNNMKAKSIESTDWFLVNPYGLSLGAMETPLFLFKEKEGGRVLPIRMSATETAVTISQTQLEKDNFTHKVSKKIIKQLGWKLKSCYFSKVEDQHQYITLYFGTDDDDSVETIEARADESLSFCLQWNCPFYCDDEFIENSRVADASYLDSFISEDEEDDSKPMYLN